ncbi:MFS transporter [Flagellimonas pacifica]|uniref:Glycoside/pentoside/hexuronide:cation symporter, GPH family n=1 Tax=Flagellimonas pacifica TaxID=1247520 RepID=A0A285MUT7_9FLAO|nr:MFS transporter [Allomuricauda parva]SNY99576.1 glycoside/pentoside/hexuronide:cation symporter, GPH family [Allomuricauda parva]
MSQKIGIQEKIGYGLGDFASSMFWKLFSMFLMIYYTDVFGLTPASVGLMFLLTRIWDSINDPLMGIICDRTNTKHGKFRPYLKWMAIPFAAIGILTFLAPDLGDIGKLIYAYITYTLMMMVYTGVNVPYSSLLGVMSSDSKERNSLATFRFIGAFAGGIFVTSTAAYFIGIFKETGANEAQGYLYTVSIYAILAAILFFVTFKWTKERVEPTKKEQSSLKDDLKDLSKNVAWFIMIGAGISTLIFNSLRDGSMMYYFKYIVKDQDISGFGNVGWEKLAATYMTMWLVSNIVGVLLSTPMANKIGKKQTFIIAMILAAVMSIMLFWVNPDQVLLLYGLNVLIGIAAGMVLPLIWSMYADIADFSEWKNGRRATGLIFSSSSMSQKMGWTLGGAIAGWILAAYGFEANADQTSDSITGIKLMLTIFPAIGALASAVFMFFYKLDDTFMEEVNSELSKIRKN